MKNDNNDFWIVVGMILICSLQVLPFLFFPKPAQAQVPQYIQGTTVPIVTGNVVFIDQIGAGNTTNITQEGQGHSATITTGTTISTVDYNVFTVMQQGAPKAALIDVKAGLGNTFSIQQDGTGNHNASIQNFIGGGNQMTIAQSGGGNHSFSVTNPNNATNNANIVNATQSGGIGSDKTFNLQFNGAMGATVNVVQTNPTTPDQAGFNIQCNPCGGWSYTKY